MCIMQIYLNFIHTLLVQVRELSYRIKTIEKILLISHVLTPFAADIPCIKFAEKKKRKKNFTQRTLCQLNLKIKQHLET